MMMIRYCGNAYFWFGLHMLKQQQQHIMNLLKLFIYIRLWLASYHMMGWLVTCWFSTSWKTKFFNNSTDQSSALLTDWLTACWWVATASYLLVLKYILTLYRWCLKSQSCYIHLYSCKTNKIVIRFIKTYIFRCTTTYG